jgi:hypothetical protein
MEIMKTKIKTIIGIVALGTIGFTNINATVDNKKEGNTNVVLENEKNLLNESCTTDEAFFNLAEELTTMETDFQIEKYATKQILLMKNSNAKSDFLTSAECFTASGTDIEIEKYAQKQLTLIQTRIGK